MTAFELANPNSTHPLKIYTQERSKVIPYAWCEPKQLATIAPHASLSLPLSDNRRYLIDCDEVTGLQIHNESDDYVIRQKTWYHNGEAEIPNVFERAARNQTIRFPAGGDVLAVIEGRLI